MVMITDIFTGRSARSSFSVTITYSDGTERLFEGTAMECLSQVDYAFGLQAGESEALSEDRGLRTRRRNITYRPEEWVTGYREGREKVVSERRPPVRPG
jgi:hypothetical protein